MNKTQEQECKDWWEKRPPNFELWLRDNRGTIILSDDLWNNVKERIDTLEVDNAKLKRRLNRD